MTCLEHFTYTKGPRYYPVTFPRYNSLNCSLNSLNSLKVAFTFRSMIHFKLCCEWCKGEIKGFFF